MPVHTRTAVGDRTLQIPPFRLATYIEGIQQGWPEHDIERVIVRGLPRHFHAQSRQTQTARLGERVPLTHTRWDALLAAMVEHLAQIHDHPIPAWVDEPERFLDPPWIVARNRWTRLNSLMFSPPAFLRHGAIPDPRDLDGRGGEHDAWAP